MRWPLITFFQCIPCNIYKYNRLYRSQTSIKIYHKMIKIILVHKLLKHIAWNQCFKTSLVNLNYLVPVAVFYFSPFW